MSNNNSRWTSSLQNMNPFNQTDKAAYGVVVESPSSLHTLESLPHIDDGISADGNFHDGNFHESPSTTFEFDGDEFADCDNNDNSDGNSDDGHDDGGGDRGGGGSGNSDDSSVDSDHNPLRVPAPIVVDIL